MYITVAYALEKITVTGGETIPAYAFSNMTNLKEIDFSQTSVTTVGHHAFFKCTALATIKLPQTVTSYEDFSFYNTAITSMPKNGVITSIGEYAFAECTKLKNFEIPETCTRLSLYAFQNCKSLTTLVIPSEVTSIGNMIFNGCTSLEKCF